MIELVSHAVWYILPAYVANGSAVILKGKTPIDQGVKFVDGRPLFGKGKTIKGFVFAALLGTSIGFLQAYLANDISFAYLGLLLSIGAMVGDTIGSFFKRRFNLKRGEAAPLSPQRPRAPGVAAGAARGTAAGDRLRVDLQHGR